MPRIALHRLVSRPGAGIVSIALGVLLLVDVLRVFLPSVITIFGQAASTPAELMGGFALLWFLAGFAAPWLAALVGPARFAAGAAVVLATARVVLLATGGGRPQLYVAAAGLLAGLGWLVATAMSPPRYATLAVLGGLALAGAQHAALGTVDLGWRRGALGWSVAAVEVAGVVWYAVRPGPVDSGAPGTAGWLLVGPAMLLSGMIANSPALATVAGSWAAPGAPFVAPALVALSTVLGVGAALEPWRRTVPRVLAVGALVAGVALFGYAPANRLGLALPLTALGLGAAVGIAARGPRRTPARHGYAAAGGMVIFADLRWEHRRRHGGRHIDRHRRKSTRHRPAGLECRGEYQILGERRFHDEQLQQPPPAPTGLIRIGYLCFGVPGRRRLGDVVEVVEERVRQPGQRARRQRPALRQGE